LSEEQGPSKDNVVPLFKDQPTPEELDKTAQRLVEDPRVSLMHPALSKRNFGKVIHVDFVNKKKQD
jgi:hypothetical protein